MSEALQLITEVPLLALAEVERITAVDELLRKSKSSAGWRRIDEFEKWAIHCPQIICPLLHVFTPVVNYPELWLYTRQIKMFAGMVITSRIHLYEHPFTISQGMVSVWEEDKGWRTYRAGHLGVTRPGTRRVLYIHEDTVWTTQHVTRYRTPEEVVKFISYDHRKLGHLDGEPMELVQLADNNVKGQSV